MILAPSASKEARVVMLFQSERLRLESIDQIATIWLDTPVMDSALVTDLSHALKAVRQSPCIDVLVIRGSKPGVFLTGPNLDECARLQSEVALRDFSLYGQHLLERLERISETIPSLAYIDGRCTNAGLELALACNYRVAVARPETLLGCDPLARGWLPCWGATQRLPRLLGLRTATRLLSEGQLLPARAARKRGLVDLAFGPRPAKAELNWFLADLQDHPLQPRRFRGKAGWFTRLWYRTAVGRSSLFDSVRASLFHDPLALGLLDALERGAKFGPAEGYQAERRALVHMVLAGQHRQRFESARAWEDQTSHWHDTQVPKRIAVVGLSRLGMDLAASALRFGTEVVVWEADESRRRASLAKLAQVIEEGVSSGWWTIGERDQKRKNLSVSRNGEGVASADLVFLTGSANEQRMFEAEMESFFRPESVIIATAPVARSRVKHPERLLTCRFDDSPDSHTVEFIEPMVPCDNSFRQLARWLDHCGYRVYGLPVVETAEEKVVAFAA
jgi:3-hydroxyacyl-CoA dehydrogenase/enoyl-CoA hydratase/3-hydroxybutyryl-CoA epimerase